jgi:hypothetical protein
VKGPSRWTVAWIVLGNLGALWGVWFAGLPPIAVAGAYLVELGVVGLMMSFVPLLPGVSWDNKDGDFSRCKASWYLFIFACIHTGGAAMIMGGLFGGVVNETLLGYVFDNFRAYWYAAAALVGSNAIMLFRWARQQHKKRETDLGWPVSQFLRLTVAATLFIFPGLFLDIFSVQSRSGAGMGSLVVFTKMAGDVIMSYRLPDDGP